ncbi:MAG: hypothetical protein RIS35_318 [Pseudomonadota bacterium]
MAARPFVTDDARLTTAGSCQLESWARSYRHSFEVWALPACNPTGNLEFTFGGGRAKPDGASSTEDYVFQVKTLVRPLQTDGWGWGLAAGTVRHPDISPGPNLLGNTYAYLPASFSFNGDRIVVHTNVGWLRERVTNRDSLTWGVGAEFLAGSRLMLIAESFGDHRNNPYWQVGARFAILPNLLQVDTTVGRQFSDVPGTRWISVGLRFTPEKLF